MTSRRRCLLGGAALVLALPFSVPAQQPSDRQRRLYRIGVIHEGGSYTAAVDGLRDGLKSLGLREGQDFVLHVRDTRGDLGSVAESARNLEAERVDLIFSVATSVTVEVKRATKAIPIVFYAGTDPVAKGLIDNFARPGGRLTGVHSRFTDLTAKRLQLLKQMVPSMRRVVTFYNTNNVISVEALSLVRDAAAKLGLSVVERPVGSIQEFQASLNALRRGDADAVFFTADAMMQSQEQSLVKAALAKKFATILSDQQSVQEGGLASYGVSYRSIGRNSAKYVQRVLAGENPGMLAVDQVETYYFVVNLKTAKTLGLKIPTSVLARADEVIR